MALIYGKQITGSIVSASIATASYALTATIATRIQSGSMTASIAPSSGGVFNISSGSTNLVYISGSTGNVGVKGYVSASGLYANTIGSGTSTYISAGTISYERLISQKDYIVLSPADVPAGGLSPTPGDITGITPVIQPLITYSSSLYFGIIIDGIIYDASYNYAGIFRCSVSNTQTTVSNGFIEVLSSTDPQLNQDITYLNCFKIETQINNYVVGIDMKNYSTTKTYHIRPMYRYLLPGL